MTGVQTCALPIFDSTIVKADASFNSLVEVNLSPEEYWKKLNSKEKPKKKLVGKHFTGQFDIDKIGKRRRDANRASLRKKSTTDPDATMFFKPGMGNMLSYKAHIATDTNGIITAVVLHHPAPFTIQVQFQSFCCLMKKYWVDLPGLLLIPNMAQKNVLATFRIKILKLL